MTQNELLNLKIEKARNIFSKHTATIKTYDDLTVVEWKNSNGEYVNSMTLIYKDKSIYISGDIGNAVFNLTWDAKIGSFENKSINYLLEKLSAMNIHDDLYVFDDEVAKTYLMKEFLVEKEIDFPDEFYNFSLKEADEYLKEHRYDIEKNYTDDNMILFLKLWENTYTCVGDQKFWEESINELAHDFTDIYNFVIEYEEALNLYDIGKTYSIRSLCYAVALQMIDEFINRRN